MRSRVLLAATLLAGLLAPSLARADGFYGGLGLGGGARLKADLAGLYDTENTSCGRIFAGKRFGPWGVEAVLFGTDLATAPGGPADYSTLSLGLGARYQLPLTSHFSLYLRGGIAKTWLTAAGENPADDGAVAVMEGTGYDYAAGVQFGFRLFHVGMSIWLDLGEQAVRLRDGTDRELDGRIQMTLLGLSLGI